MSSKHSRPAPAFASLVRSRLRTLTPLGVVCLSGLAMYWFFLSIGPPRRFPEFSLKEPKHPHSPIDKPSQASAVNSSPTNPPVVEHENLTKLLDLKQYEGKKLLELPILHRTFKDPFDPKAGFKPLLDAKFPWSANTPRGEFLLNRIGRSRFPPPGTAGALPRSSLPPFPSWPPPSALREKPDSLKRPISKEQIPGLNTSFVWKERPLIKHGKLPRVQWLGFDRVGWESESDRVIRLERQGWVRRAFQHVWEGYKLKAWGHDELKPVSGSFQDPFSGWGATLVDCLDTLLIMNMTQEYNYARTHVKAIDWSYTLNDEERRSFGSRSTSRPKISPFETVIRYVGGLISAYDLSGDELMLHRAVELADWLLPAFGTSTGLPVSPYQLGTKPQFYENDKICLAEAGSLTLEFTRLSQLTSKDYYYDLVQKITDFFDRFPSGSNRPGTLIPTHFYPLSPEPEGLYTLGATADSYYECLAEQLFSFSY